MLDDYNYMVLCTDTDSFMMKSECEELGLNYIDLFSDLVDEFDEDEIETMLYGESWE